ncbi:MAG: L,D-transpeptidase family protein [Clostridiales bacterium]|nr:L,D-transpeptidase family protein [Clostridiales bacterium]
MKKRRSLLFGLGILVTLSMAVPVSAAENNTPASVTELGTGEENTPADAEGLSNTETTTDGTEKAGVEAVYQWVEEEGKWKLTDADGVSAADGIYTIGENGIFCISGGYLVTGVQAIEGKDEVGYPIKESGKYYFAETGTSPEADGLGKLVKADQWVSTKDSKWIKLNADGKVDETKTAWQNINGHGWYYLSADGSVDKSQNGWKQPAENCWVYAENGKGTVKTGWQEVASGKWMYLKGDGTRDAAKKGWQEVVSGKWYFLKEDGTRETGKTGMQTIGKDTYFLNAEGAPQKGFQNAEGKTYYFDESTGIRQNYTGWKVIKGKLYFFNNASQVANSGANGWQHIEGKWYWFENGNAATGWRAINGKWYYMDADTAVMQTGLFTAADGNKYYCDGSGAMIGAGWNFINGNWYWMNGSGAVATGWIRPDGVTWYYMRNNGTMAAGWYQVNGTWYYSNGSGAMQTGWQYIGGAWYYLSGSGAMLTGWYNLGGTWYYSSASGAMQVGWQKINGTWYYLSGSGAMLTGWQHIGGAWYYLAGSGAMQTGWLNLGGTWYYLAESGAMQTGWIKLGSTWYYLTGSGAMAANTWVDGYYYVNGSGAMVTNTWVGSYYVGADGRWIPNYDPLVYGGKWEQSGGKWYFKCGDGTYLKNRWQKLNSQWYYFEADGAMVTGWKYIGGYKYYFNNSGQLVQDLDSVIGRQSSYYITVNRAKCQVTVYAADGANGYIIPVKTFACSVGMPNTPTPVGTFKTPAKYRWHTLMGPSYGQYCTRVVGGILFHSVAGSNMTSYNLSASEYNKLGGPASHGCIRLTVRDAKWIYDNCGLGTTVTISDTAATPFDKPVTPKIPASQNWDPTDPNL